jgi:hypothetical protein
MIQSIDVETLIKQAAEYFRLGEAELASDSCEFAQLSIRAACAEHAHTLRRFENYRNVEMKKTVSNEGDSGSKERS